MDYTNIVTVVCAFAILYSYHQAKKLDEIQEYFAYGGARVDSLEQILFYGNGRWMPVESIHRFRTNRFFGERSAEEYLWITARDCDALVRDGYLRRRKHTPVGHLFPRVEYCHKRHASNHDNGKV